MRKRVKYTIIYSIVGLFLSYIVRAIAGVLAWLLILGDGPISSTQNQNANFFVFGITISFWLFIVYLGYRLGIEAENSTDTNTAENHQKNLYFIKKAILKIILTIVIVFIILISLAFWSISRDKHSQTSIDTKNVITDEENNKMTKNVNFSNEPGKCFDTDGGKDYYKKGMATISGTGSIDCCRESLAAGPCLPQSQHLIEGYCENGKPLGELYECPKGCADGACIK